ncbi:Predicted arabinose efflux permease, MFS family [Lentzea fradiae]|uniref:Predicted arabinose efflux permease, MFS family n=1 Tax=Lentzea fradiae TaxID=200378 RepID=A0A1G7REV1_9PSEU|nr:MFS transporter [Lentzea fradiae]SDG09175.1 Predicted arabinose efflux permease, MFS family [Lentzea fradiae]
MSGFDRRLITPLVAGAVLNPVNTTILSVALVPIGLALGEPPSAVAWLVTSLYVSTAIGQPVAGLLIDRYGPRRLFLPATALVGVAGALGTVAPNLAVLVVARVLLGLGTCAGYPAAMRLLRDEADRTGEDSPGGVLTILAVATQTTAVIGPPLGGVLIDLGGWRTTLAINVPLALAAFVLGWRHFPRDRAPRRPQRTRSFTLSGLNAPLLVTYFRAMLSSVVAYGFIYGFTQWLQAGRGFSAGESGLVLLPLFATAIVVAAVSGRSEALRAHLVLGSAGQVVVCLLMLTLTPASPLWLILLVTLVSGVPQGLVNLALQHAVYRQADPARVAGSTGMMRTFLYVGAIAVGAVQGVVFGDRVDTDGLRELTAVLLGASVVFLLVNVFDRSLSRPRE